MNRTDVQKLLEEFRYRRDLCFFPERCFELENAPELIKGWQNLRTWTWPYESLIDVKEEAVSIANWNDLKGGGVVSVSYTLDTELKNLGKDSKEILREEFSGVSPDLKLVALWSKITRLWPDCTLLTIFLQYSPVKK